MNDKPRWEGSFEGYARKFVRANHWKVRHTLEPDDALQECAVVFIRCCRRYPDKVNSPARLMAIYKRMLVNAFADHAQAGRRHRQTLEACAEAYAPHSTAAAAPLVVALNEASPELRQVLQMIGMTPERLPAGHHGMPKHAATRRQLSRLWCQLADTTRVRTDLVNELQAIVGG